MSGVITKEKIHVLVVRGDGLILHGHEVSLENVEALSKRFGYSTETFPPSIDGAITQNLVNLAVKSFASDETLISTTGQRVDLEL